ncbi:hypothetical protein A3Q56_04572 [Intoshia linei]|uniref:HAT C-terminal dimerisation domain-containing protein n=1 Tax=Intoshia linei TaxID=1819745 RepID=A0A177B0E2_9BILA|nr:hypothetical protein A3Q56_04572 [Intoshia linei]
MNRHLEKIEAKIYDREEYKSPQNVVLTCWKSMPKNFKGLKKVALSLLTFFGSTYNCEQTFSIIALNNTKVSNRLSVELIQAQICLKTSSYRPDIEKITSDFKQHHPSH